MNIQRSIKQGARRLPGAKRLAEALGSALLHYGLRARRRQLTRRLSPQLSRQVLAGPFAGMQLLDQTSWGDFVAKVLGTYEAELHPILFDLISSLRYDLVVNVGCAEGYYAVGLAIQMPPARVYAFDISEQAQKICALAAERNMVGDRLSVAGLCNTATLNAILKEGEKALLVLDCEGSEIDLLRPDAVPYLKNSDILVECHDFLDPRITTTLVDRFKPTHTIQRIEEGDRLAQSLPFLQNLGSLDRFAATYECRQADNRWLFCKTFG